MNNDFSPSEIQSCAISLPHPRAISARRIRSHSRARSPLKLVSAQGRICDTTSDLYISATKKLSEAAWRYDRERDPGRRNFVRKVRLLLDESLKLFSRVKTI